MDRISLLEEMIKTQQEEISILKKMLDDQYSLMKRMGDTVLTLSETSSMHSEAIRLINEILQAQKP